MRKQRQGRTPKVSAPAALWEAAELLLDDLKAHLRSVDGIHLFA